MTRLTITMRHTKTCRMRDCFRALFMDTLMRCNITVIYAYQTVSDGTDFLVVKKYLNDHPEQLHLHQGILIDKALIEAFPCK